MLTLQELDERVSIRDQLKDDSDEPVVLINVFHVAPEQTEYVNRRVDRRRALLQDATGLYLDPIASRHWWERNVSQLCCLGKRGRFQGRIC